MNIENIKDAIFIGNVVINKKDYTGSKSVLYKNSLRINYSKDLPQGLVSKHLSIVYFICVNNEIYKIGQTSGKSGIKGCLGFYCCAGQDVPGANRFTINALMRDALSCDKKVSVYMKYIGPVSVSVKGINKIHNALVPISAKCLEEAHLSEHQELTGNFPPWNFQEANTAVPALIAERYAIYMDMRAKDRK